MAARASNCDILDGVYNQLDNLEGFAKICAEGKSLGFDGKTLIHPKQLDAANTVFSPSEDEVTSAKAIIEAWQAMQQSEEAGKKGVLVVNGRLVEELHVLEAERVCALASAIAEKQA
jgi:citrate lyase subunit beta/citryl-CoA lyase